MTNTLYYGDNFKILREYIRNESIDLIYLDPPFNSNRSYNVLFKDEKGKESQSQIEAFDDTWHWNDETEARYRELVTEIGGDVGAMIEALRSVIGTNQMMAYLVMMAIRLVELHRVLKPTGSLYLHCDTTASHYLKIVLDQIFGIDNYRNEISWERSGRRSSIKKVYRRAHDVILFYTKTDTYTYNLIYKEHDETLLRKYSQYDDAGRYRLVPLMGSGRVINGETGRTWRGYDPNTRGKGGMHWLCTHAKLEEYVAKGLVVFPKKPDGVPQLKYYLAQNKGVPLSDFWGDIDLINSMGNESLGYPTQKPLALLERIISASSNTGDVVLDPFCGCGTAVAAAEKLGRQWIGIDITHLSIALQKYRLEQMFPGIQMKIVGEPEDIGAAQKLANDDRYQFQWWALSLVRAKPLGGEAGSKTGKKGADKGIDGVINFIDDNSNKSKRVLVQVKSGHVNSATIRDLVGTVTREQAAIGALVTLEVPTRDMKTEAAGAGIYRSPGWGQDFPRIQILTIQELLAGVQVKMPPAFGTFKQAQATRRAGEDAVQAGLDFDALAE